MICRKIILLLLIANNTMAQTSNDTIGIKNCIEHYFKAADNSNTEELSKAFYPGAMMFWVDSTGRMDYITQNGWKTRMKENSNPIKAIERLILNFDITNDNCIAKIRSTYTDKVYIDYLALVKTGTVWRIVNKTFVKYKPNQIPTFDELKEKQQITSLIETKFKSMDNNDADLLASAYYPRAMSYYNDNSQITAVSIAEWIARFEYDKRKGNNKNTKAIRKIEKIDLFDNIGYVSFSHTFTSSIVTDKVLVLKVDNRWKIINLLITF
jgi:Putative lumazine-binding